MPMTQPLKLEPGSNQDVEVLRLEVEELKREEDRIRFLRQEKEDRLRALIFRMEMAE
jgi:FtsZ-binding cell division protein ZapB